LPFFVRFKAVLAIFGETSFSACRKFPHRAEAENQVGEKT